MLVRANGYAHAPVDIREQLAARECTALGIPAELVADWQRSPERNRWTYWADTADVDADLTSEQREERLARCGGYERLEVAKRVAVTDFLQRVREEKLNGGGP